MPNAPRTLCHCGGRKIGGRCERCGTKRGKHPRKTSERGYGWDWQRFREQYLWDHPLCMDCEAECMVTPATEVHHRQKIKDAPGRRLEAENCMALCDRHHNERTARGE